jgi:hypothetical protein
MSQIENDDTVAERLQLRTQSAKPRRQKVNRNASGVDRLHERHLLGRGYSDIMAKITEDWKSKINASNQI